LSISRGLIEAMGGTISVESKKEKGTIFKIHIPWQK
jgi:signal transduction histidine kinase